MSKEVTSRKRNIKDTDDKNNTNSAKSRPEKKEKRQVSVKNDNNKKSSKGKQTTSSNYWNLIWLICTGAVLIFCWSVGLINLKEIDYALQLRFGIGLPFVNNPKDDLTFFTNLLANDPTLVDAKVGKAKALEQLAFLEHSNQLLEASVDAYEAVISHAKKNPNSVPVEVLRGCALTATNILTFIGYPERIIPLLLRVTAITDDLTVQKLLGRSYIAASDTAMAKEVFHNILQKWPNSGFAQAYYGFTLKIVDNNLTEAIKYLRSGIDSGEEGTQDKQLYLHLGDAYQRLKDDEKAYEVYDDAVAKKIFLSRFQRPLDAIDRLKAKPIWTLEETTYEPFFRKLAANWEKILAEALPILDIDTSNGWRQEEYLRREGEWGQFMMYDIGVRNETNCAKAPFTCSLIEGFPPAATNKRGQVKFSLLKPGTTVFKHTGPTNCRLRSHLGLITPPGAALQVVDSEGPNLFTWEAGKVVVFDDSFEHEVWHKGDSLRLILLVDVWHPEVTEEEKLRMR